MNTIISKSVGKGYQKVAACQKLNLNMINWSSRGGEFVLQSAQLTYLETHCCSVDITLILYLSTRGSASLSDWTRLFTSEIYCVFPTGFLLSTKWGGEGCGCWGSTNRTRPLVAHASAALQSRAKIGLEEVQGVVDWLGFKDLLHIVL